jgi:GT2 family glycosyltransferase
MATVVPSIALRRWAAQYPAEREHRRVAVGRIGALILTYNRKELLSRCLEAIAAQSRPPDEVIVLDNGSADGTADYLRKAAPLGNGRVHAYRVENNLGSAAGFDVLFRIAYRRGLDWLWCMDDDVIANRTALQELMAAFADNFSRPEELGFLISTAVSEAGEPSNVPEVDTRARPFQCPSWAECLDRGLVKLRWATFNSILIPRSSLLRVGGLAPDFHFAGEDVDFTLRVTEVLPAYLVGKSKVTHLRVAGGVFSALTQPDPQRIRMAPYYYRNTLYFRRRYYSGLRTVLFIGKCFWEALLASRCADHRLLRAASILRGVVAGLWFFPQRPPIEAPLPTPVIDLLTGDAANGARPAPTRAAALATPT